MSEIPALIIGVLILAMGYFIGELLARFTKEELTVGRKWIRIVVLIGLIGGTVGLIIGSDFLLFGFFFMAIVSVRSLKKVVNRKKYKK